MVDKINISLREIVLQGIVASGIMVIVIAWCVRIRGPLYASIFNPLMLVLVALAGSLMLDENLYLGRYIYTKSYSAPKINKYTIINIYIVCDQGQLTLFV